MKLSGRIVLVEDEATHAELITNLCKDVGLSITTYTNAEDYYQHTEDFDVLITDANLPADNGFDICRKLKKDKKTKENAVMFVSGVDDPETIASAYEAGATAYSIKPIIAVEFIHQIEGILKQAKLSKKLKDKSEMARQVAMDSMKESERLHSVIEFVQEASSCKSYESVANVTFATTQRLKLHASIMFHLDNNEVLFFADDDEDHEFERKLMMELWHKVNSDRHIGTRFFTANNRAAASFHNCSMFIRRSDKSKVESLLDFLGLFMNQLEKTADKITSQKSVLHYISQATESLTNIEKQLEGLQQMMKDLKEEDLDNKAALLQKFDAHITSIQKQMDMMVASRAGYGRYND